MKILHTVEFYAPSVGGAQEVVRQVSERLVSRGHTVTVATSKLTDRKDKKINGVEIAEFEITGNAVKGYRSKKGERARYQQLLVDGGFDVVMNYAAQQWSADLAFEVLGKMRAKRVLVPCGFSGLHRPAYKKYFAQMPRIMAQYDACVYTSERYWDAELARKHRLENGVLIPNGASKEEFEEETKLEVRQRLGVPEDYFLIVTVGSHTGNKGHAEAIKIFNKSKLKKAVLLVLGNSFGRGCQGRCKREALLSRVRWANILNMRQVWVAEWSREWVVAALKQADVFLFPSNIECSPLVLFEAMAAKTAFLTTDVGNAKEIVEWSEGGLVLPTKKGDKLRVVADIEGSIELLSELYEDGKLRDKLATSGYVSWKKRFTWEKITLEYEKLYKSLLSK